MCFAQSTFLCWCKNLTSETILLDRGKWIPTPSDIDHHPHLSRLFVPISFFLIYLGFVHDMKVMGSSSSSTSSLFPLTGLSSSSVPLQQGNKNITNGSNGICHSKRRKLQPPPQFPQQSNHRRHISFTLTITGLVVTALFLNVVLVHVRLFSDFASAKRKSITLDSSESLQVEVENSNGNSIGETKKHNNHNHHGIIDDGNSDSYDALGTKAIDETTQILPSVDETTSGIVDTKDQTMSVPSTEQEPPTTSHHQSETGRSMTKVKNAKSSNNQNEPSPYNTFSACMLIKDDNDLLNEWLAYHYHVLNLRYLVVAVDPNSATSPTPIFEKWRSLTGMKIVEWSDKDFMPPVFLLTGYHISPNLIDGDAKKSKFHEGTEEEEKVKADNLMITNHRFRQITFLEKCLKHMRNHKKAWTMHIDTDEFVVINPLLRNTTQVNVNMINIPPIQEKGSIANVVNQYFKDDTLREKFNYPCISMPRLLFGSVEFEDNTTYPEEVMRYFNVSMIESIRWQYHTDFDDKDRNAQPKVIIDVSVVPRTNDMFNKPFSIHRPSKFLCRRIAQLDFKQLQRYPITVNHYTGSWERYFSKSDTRRSERAYNSKAHVAAGHDTYMAPWLMGFVNHVGLDLAKELLDDYLITAAPMETALFNESTV